MSNKDDKLAGITLGDIDDDHDDDGDHDHDGDGDGDLWGKFALYFSLARTTVIS